MTTIEELTNYANNLLGLHDHRDYGPMGLQFRGKEKVESIAVSVSIDKETIERARNFDVLLVHHGLFWNNEPRHLDPRGRLELLEKYGISVLGYHLALDVHSKFGNNVLIARAMGAQQLTPWRDVGYQGTFKEAKTREAIFGRAYDKLDDMPPIMEPIEFYQYGPEKIRNIAVITGGGAHYITQAAEDGFDLFMTGEVAEPTQYLAKDLGMNFLAYGHYRTETAGVKSLGRHLSKVFGLRYQFLRF
jgi:dinuclear metal center YbgI/SA1388 family protein